MRSEFLTVTLLLCASAGFGQADAHPTKGAVVPNWYRTGNNVNGVYSITADTQTVHGGKSSVTIRCDSCSPTRTPENATEAESAFGSIVQNIRPDEFRGKRIAFSAYLKTSNVQGDGAGLWLRVDNAEGTEELDNMYAPDRLLRGTSDWKKYRVVLDVPQDAQMLAMGAILSGKGQVWIDDATLQTVGPEVAPTADEKKFMEGMKEAEAKWTPEQRAEAEKILQQKRESAKTAPSQLQNPGFEQ